ncbi:hypothetical protein BASA60_005105 [Batrachochytrium salamandrivorans]|nr:hypothetical protein BASA60_005105 [Batrachochytrium salamandrivorans]
MPRKSSGKSRHRNSRPEYEVEEIVDDGLDRKGHRIYLVKWKGYSSQENTWEPAAHLSCPAIMKRYKEDKRAQSDRVRLMEKYQSMALNIGLDPKLKSGSSFDDDHGNSLSMSLLSKGSSHSLPDIHNDTVAIDLTDDSSTPPTEKPLIDLNKPTTLLLSDVLGGWSFGQAVTSNTLSPADFPVVNAAVVQHSALYKAATSTQDGFTLYHQQVVTGKRPRDTRPDLAISCSISPNKPVQHLDLSPHAVNRTIARPDFSGGGSRSNEKTTLSSQHSNHKASIRTSLSSDSINKYDPCSVGTVKSISVQSSHLAPRGKAKQKKEFKLNETAVDAGSSSMNQPLENTTWKNGSDTRVRDTTQSYYNVTIDLTGNTAGPPRNFLWTEKFIFHKDVPAPDTDRVFGCDCNGPCVSLVDEPEASPCSCVEDTKMPYDSYGLVCIRPRECMIKECNDKCLCDTGCPNRVSQRASMAYLEVFWCGRRGWGVRTKNWLPAGAFVSKYFGEVITEMEAAKRSAESREYHFAMDFNEGLLAAQGIPVKIIDAYKCGNVSRFFNHSCCPNMASYCIQVDSTDPDLHHIAFFTLRDIEPGEELTFDYSNSSGVDNSFEQNRRAKSRSRSLGSGSAGSGFNTKGSSKTARLSSKSGSVLIKCLCGTADCRGAIHALE